VSQGARQLVCLEEKNYDTELLPHLKQWMSRDIQKYVYALIPEANGWPKPNN
jgi:hypothetical protein